MKREEVIRRLSGERERLQAMGVASLALFGSTVRDDALDSSDIDLLVSFNRPITLFDYADIERSLSDLLENSRVDLVDREAVLDELKERILGEAIPCL